MWWKWKQDYFSNTHLLVLWYMCVCLNQIHLTVFSLEVAVFRPLLFLLRPLFVLCFSSVPSLTRVLCQTRVFSVELRWRVSQESFLKQFKVIRLQKEQKETPWRSWEWIFKHHSAHWTRPDTCFFDSGSVSGVPQKIKNGFEWMTYNMIQDYVCDDSVNEMMGLINK